MSEELTGYRGSYDLSSPAGHVGIGKVVYIDRRTALSPPPWEPTRYWAYEKPQVKGDDNRSFFGAYRTSYEAYVGLSEWAKSEGLTAVKIKKAVYISVNGDDKNDGLTPKTPVRSWGRFFMLTEKGDDVHFMEQECFDGMMGEAHKSERERSVQENLVDGLPPGQ